MEKTKQYTITEMFYLYINLYLNILTNLGRLSFDLSPSTYLLA